MDFFFLIILAVLAALVVGPVLSIVALVRARDLREEMTRLQRTVRQLQAARQEPPPPLRPQEPAKPPTAAVRTRGPRVSGEAVQPVEPSGEPTARPAPPPSPPPPVTTAASTDGPGGRQGVSFEEALAGRWLVGLGAIAVAAAVVFLVRYSMEMGWLGPAVRCFAGAAFGLALIGGGEWLRRRPFERVIAPAHRSLIPPALTGSGIFALFVSVYAAYGLYGLLPWQLAFAGLGAIWLAALALSLLHGWGVAVLGILGGFLVPILIQTGNPSAYKLFPYLFTVTATSLSVLRYRGWGWLAWGALAGAAIWPVLWMVEMSHNLGTPAVGAYLTATAALFLYVPAGTKPHRSPVTLARMFAMLPPPALLGWCAAGAMLVLSLILTVVDDFGTWSVVWAGLLGGLMVGAGRRDETFDGLAIAAAVQAAAILLWWFLPYWPGDLDILAALPPGLVPFAAASAGYAALYGLSGLILHPGSARPGLWAGVSAATPLAILAIAFWRIKDFEVDLTWAAMSLVLGAVYLGAAVWVSRRRSASGMEAALAAYAAGVVAAASLAMAMALENAWLTVALSVQLPALAWIYGRTAVHGLRVLALFIASAILVRLVLNYQVFDYPLGATPGLNWMLYGYGLPTLAFYAAARMFRKTRDDRLVLALEAGTLVFLTLFVSLEITDLVHGGRFVPGTDFLETSLRSIAWLIIAYGLLWQCRATEPRIVAVWGWRILAGLAGVQILLVQLLGQNPLGYRVDVGDWPVFNLLLLAYGVPAVLAILLRLETRRQAVPQAPQIAGIAALVLVFTWLSLEIRRAFHPNFLYLGGTSDAEWWAYSGAWLIFALALLALGILRRNTPLRYASLAVLILTVTKVFLFDLYKIGGLYQVASPLALGLTLFGIAWLYRRFVFPPGGPLTQD